MPLQGHDLLGLRQDLVRDVRGHLVHLFIEGLNLSVDLMGLPEFLVQVLHLLLLFKAPLLLDA